MTLSAPSRHIADVTFPSDYKTENFETVIRDYDVVFETQGGKTLETSIRVLRQGGTLIEIVGPPDPALAKEIRANPIVALATILCHQTNIVGVKFRGRSDEGESTRTHPRTREVSGD